MNYTQDLHILNEEISDHKEWVKNIEENTKILLRKVEKLEELKNNYSKLIEENNKLRNEKEEIFSNLKTFLNYNIIRYGIRPGKTSDIQAYAYVAHISEKEFLILKGSQTLRIDQGKPHYMIKDRSIGHDRYHLHLLNKEIISLTQNNNYIFNKNHPVDSLSGIGVLLRLGSSAKLDTNIFVDQGAFSLEEKLLYYENNYI